MYSMIFYMFSGFCQNSIHIVVFSFLFFIFDHFVSSTYSKPDFSPMQPKSVSTWCLKRLSRRPKGQFGQRRLQLFQLFSNVLTNVFAYVTLIKSTYLLTYLVLCLGALTGPAPGEFCQIYSFALSVPNWVRCQIGSGAKLSTNRPSVQHVLEVLKWFCKLT